DDYDIDLIRNPGERPERALWKRCGLVLAGDLPRRHAACPYDLFVHDLSRDPVRSPALDLLRRFRGLVVLPEDDGNPAFVSVTALPPHAAGVAVPAAAAWPGVRPPELPVAVIPPPPTATIREAARGYAAVIEATICQRDAGDALWSECAAEALAACPD